MKIRILGARGGITVSGVQFNEYGGNTSCLHLIDDDNNSIVLDAGSGVKNLNLGMFKSLEKESIILLTHFHIDHIIGIPFFMSFFIKDFKFTVYAPKDTQDEVYNTINGILDKDYFPVSIENFNADVSFETFTEGKKITYKSFDIEAMWVNHPSHTLSYKIKNKDKVFVYLTDHEPYESYLHPTHSSLSSYNGDTKALHSRLIEFARDSDVLVIDGEYTDEEYEGRHIGWGHSSINASLKFALEANVKCVIFHHHGQNRTDVQINILYKSIISYLDKENISIEVLFSRENHYIEL